MLTRSCFAIVYQHLSYCAEKSTVNLFYDVSSPAKVKRQIATACDRSIKQKMD